MEEGPKKKQNKVVAISLGMTELNKTLKEILEGIQGVIREIHDQRKMDIKIHHVLEDC